MSKLLIEMEMEMPKHCAECDMVQKMKEVIAQKGKTNNADN